VFRSAAFTGPPQETAEAEPEWFRPEELPYDEMWEDDRHWLPLLLEGRTFRGLVAFDEAGETMARCDLETGVAFEEPDTGRA